MKNWIDRWLMGVAIAHTVFGVVVFRQPLSALVEGGVFNMAGSGPTVAVAVWFLLFGVALFITGLAIHALERASVGPLPKSLGGAQLVLAVLGVVLMPASGFWLAFPPAIALLVRR